MNKKQKNTLIRIIISLALFLLLIAADKTGLAAALLPGAGIAAAYLIIFVIAGWDVCFKAIRNIKNGQIFDENFLMLTAAVAGFAIGEYSEALAVMIFYQVGEFFQSYAVGRSRRSIADMMSIAPEYANRISDEGVEEVDPEEISTGDLILIKPGERIPLDGIVKEGESGIDTSALTGESLPAYVRPGMEVISGCVNKSGTLKVEVTKEYEDSTVSRILELVENASEKKSRVESFITRFARYYTPIVTTFAVLLAIIPPVIFKQNFNEWIHRACIFLIVSCPCALVISVPLGFFGGIGAASRMGILVKGSNYLELASRVKTLVFDKTGTLTKGQFKVTKVMPSNNNNIDLLKLAAHAEAHSNHPIALSIREAYEGEIDLKGLEKQEEIPGHGTSAIYDGKELLAGNKRLLEDKNIGVMETGETGTVIHIAYDGNYQGYILVSDVIKNEATGAIKEAKGQGVQNVVMLTGDKVEIANKTADIVGVDKVCAELLPQDKVRILEDLLENKPQGSELAFAGDGINDAPVLMRSDVGIAMGSMGSDAAIEAADIVIMDDDLNKIAKVMEIGRKTMTIVRQNIVFALGVKLAVLIMGAAGAANMWEAVFADVGVSVIAILNSMRTLKVSQKKT